MVSDSESELREKILSTLNSCRAIQQNDSKQALALARKMHTLAQREADAGLQARTLITMADILRFTHRYKDIVSCFERLERLYPIITNNTDFAYASKALGVYHSERGNFTNAITYLSQAIIIYRNADSNSSDIAHTLNSMGIVLRRTGNYDNALRYYYEAYHIAQESNDNVALIKSCVNIGVVLMSLKNYNKAIEYLEEAFVLSKRYTDRQGMAYSVENIGWCYLYQNSLSESSRYFQKALILWKSMNLMSNIMIALHGYGDVLLQQKKYKKSNAVLDEAYQLAESLNNKQIMSRILRAMAEIRIQTGEYDAALEKFNMGIYVLNGTEYFPELLDIHDSMAKLYSIIGKFREAYHHKETAEKLHSKIFGIEHMREVTSIEVKEALYKLEKNQADLRQRTLTAELAVENKEKELRELTETLSTSYKVLDGLRDILELHIENSVGDIKQLASNLLEEMGKKPSKNYLPIPDANYENTYSEFIRKLHIKYPNLTPTEIKVCILIKLNYSNKQIADLLSCSLLTVKTHRTHIRKKLSLIIQENLINTLHSI
jgi:tetratricopeptide (TPR) repeat protein